jgi:hypothetical protein
VKSEVAGRQVGPFFVPLDYFLLLTYFNLRPSTFELESAQHVPQ